MHDPFLVTLYTPFSWIHYYHYIYISLCYKILISYYTCRLWLHQHKSQRLRSRRRGKLVAATREFLLIGCYPIWAFFVVEFFFICFLLFFFLSVSSWPCKTFSWPCKTPFVTGSCWYSFLFGYHFNLVWWWTYPPSFYVCAQLIFSFLVYPSWAVHTLELISCQLSISS